MTPPPHRASFSASLGDGVLLVLAILFALVTAIFFLGLLYGLRHATLLFVVPQAVMSLAFGLLDLRLWQILRARRSGHQPPGSGARPA
jgi:hypothetical protein